MIVKNTVIFNMEQICAIFEKHMKDEIFKDANFVVTKLTFDHSKNIVTVDLGPKPVEAVEVS